MRIPCTVAMLSKMGQVVTILPDGSPEVRVITVVTDRTFHLLIGVHKAEASPVFEISIANSMTLFRKFAMKVHQTAINTKKHGVSDKVVWFSTVFTRDIVLIVRGPGQEAAAVMGNLGYLIPSLRTS